MADSEDDESLAGLTQNTFLKAPLEPCFDLFSGLLEGDCNVGDVIYEQRERVFHRDIQTRENNV